MPCYKYLPAGLNRMIFLHTCAIAYMFGPPAGFCPFLRTDLECLIEHGNGRRVTIGPYCMADFREVIAARQYALYNDLRIWHANPHHLQHLQEPAKPRGGLSLAIASCKLTGFASGHSVRGAGLGQWLVDQEFIQPPAKATTPCTFVI